jgi:pimeloyl-ACP methyl ester carboxylesterase
MKQVFRSFLLGTFFPLSILSIPSTPFNFTQRVDHFSMNQATYEQRYYQNLTNFVGPGSPIICIMGGEGAIPETTGIFYPPMVLLAERLGAAIIEPEHRFYGTSQPSPPFDTQRLQLLTAPQALEDAIAFIQAKQEELGCSGKNGQPRCPVVTVGGSYPAWLAAMMRLRYPAVVDIAYAASAPMHFYAQTVDQYAYYRVITESAERASPGCPAAVRTMLASTLATATKDEIVSKLLCLPLPEYLQNGDLELLVNEVSMVFTYSWANLNMANYPPPNTGLLAACQMIQSVAPLDPWNALLNFLSSYAASSLESMMRTSGQQYDEVGSSAGCYNISTQLPSGANATITGGDWSGDGTGLDGSSWDFETCTLLVEAIGMNNVSDMFLPREWSYDWLSQHCMDRFGVVPQPRALADMWGFDEDVLPSITSHIIFTSGLNDGWSAGGIVRNLSNTILAFNMPNGAHHSDLSHLWPSSSDTQDVYTTRNIVADLIAQWLEEITEKEIKI